MADFYGGANDNQTTDLNGFNNGSRRSSQSSGHSSSNKENQTGSRKGSLVSENSNVDNSSERELILKDGDRLGGESRTERTSSVSENTTVMNTFDSSTPQIPGRQPTIQVQSSGTATARAKAAKSPYSSTPISSIPEDDITIPNDANLSAYTTDQLANFLKCLKVDDRIVSHLHRKSVDGKRFAKFKDSELDTLGLKNPVIIFFRDKSNLKVKKKGQFML